MFPLPTASIVAASSSRLTFKDTPSSTSHQTAASSQLYLNRPESINPVYSNTATTTTQSGSSSWLNSSLNLRHVEIIVLATCFVSGLTDTAMFANYNTFVSMQTGNTIFIALGASQQNTHPFIWVRSLFSLITYCLGTFLFARLHNQILAPKTRRLTLLLSYTTQALLIILAASIIQSGVVGRYAPGAASSPSEQWDSLAPICLLSLGAGGQILAARSLGISEVPTTVVTSMLCELWADPRLFSKRNAARDRRAAAFVLLLLGAITGGWVDKVSQSAQAALWMAAALKLFCVAAVAFWKAESSTHGSAGAVEDGDESKSEA